MYNIYDEYLCKALQLFFRKEILDSDLDEIIPPNSLNECSFKKVKANTEIIKADTRADHVYILFTGRCKCLVYSSLGDSIVVDTMKSPYIFGLLELINSIPKYTASIITTRESIYLKIPFKIFQHAMKNSLTVSNICTCYFASISMYYMEIAEIRALYDIDDTILLYIYNNCDKSEEPYKINATRKTISHLLHINLRSLYRHLKKLKDMKFFNITNGKITISKEQYKKIQDHCFNELDIKQYPIRLYPETFKPLFDNLD